ncbi:MAG TPA: HlyD family efflux transporter periplasmic adaptor subunit [Candidatus Accumulibacter phosphatis]|nr:HlyD family efflux transporter periplasmic adaptor subunit [Candidatus Accumulibacter phosphatis]
MNATTVLQRTLQPLLFAASLVASAGLAHEGHVHGDEPAPALTRGDGPQRLADGNVFLPKTTQRQLALRTQITGSGEHPVTVELAGKVVLDPGSGGRVQAMNTGRVEAPAGGIPSLGKAVKKGELLARVHPAVSPLELGGQRAQAAELRAALGVAERRLARLRELEATVARKDDDAAEADVQSLRERLAAITRSISQPEDLRAPVAGVVASASVVAGQVVEARELLFEIVDPANLRVEALAYDPRLAAEIAGAYGSAGPGQEVLLTFVGAGRSLREQAIPLLFRVDGGTATLALNQPLRVIAQTRSPIKGVPLPAAAVVKSSANQEIVWVKTSAERFAPRPVRTQPLDGTRVAVIDGLEAGVRVVVQGAALLNQVR